MEIRFAEENELEKINELRKQVNDLHVEGRPETFRPGFPDALRDYIYTVFRDPDKRVVVCVCEGRICAFAILARIVRPETFYMFERDYLDIDEFCVDSDFRRQGIGARMIDYISDFARNEGFDRVELNMWEFNREALAFYESAGFTTYRRYMEMKL